MRLVIPALLICCACSGGGAMDAGLVGCEMDPTAQAYVAGMKQTGTNGKMSFQLMSSDPGPPLRGTNVWKLKVLDAMNQPVTGATLTVTPFMPEHGHGSSQVPMVSTDNDDYTISNLYLFMPGLWRVTIAATAGSDSDSAAFTFCVAG